MKLNKWLYGAMALGLLAACSERDIAPGGGGNDDVKYVEGTSFLGISLELPTEPSTRATEGKDFGDQANDNFLLYIFIYCVWMDIVL